MRLTKSFKKEKYKGQRNLIYGAGFYGELAYYDLKALSLEAYAFIDSFVKWFLGYIYL